MDQFGEGVATVRRCAGIIACINYPATCQITIRPHTKAKKVPEQLSKLCMCGGALQLRKCPALARLYRFSSGVFYEHKGEHNHAKPSHILHLTPDEKGALQELVTDHPKSGALALVVGVSTLHGPGKSTADISPALINQDRVKAEVRAIKSEQTSRGDRFIGEFSQFCKEHPGFIIASQFGVTTVVSVQTDFMATQLIKDAMVPDKSDALYGLVSDAAHGFWRQRDYLLIVSSVYSFLLSCWVPGILSFSNGASAEHYKLHFLALFKSIAKETAKRGQELQTHHFAGVRLPIMNCLVLLLTASNVSLLGHGLQ